jgi:hypothetical protein
MNTSHSHRYSETFKTCNMNKKRTSRKVNASVRYLQPSGTGSTEVTLQLSVSRKHDPRDTERQPGLRSHQAVSICSLQSSQIHRPGAPPVLTGCECSSSSALACADSYIFASSACTTHSTAAAARTATMTRTSSSAHGPVTVRPLVLVRGRTRKVLMRTLWISSSGGRRHCPWPRSLLPNYSPRAFASSKKGVA